MTDSQARDLIGELKATNRLLKQLADHLLQEQNIEPGHIQMLQPSPVIPLLTGIHQLLQAWIEHDMDRGAKLLRKADTVNDHLGKMRNTIHGL